MQEIILKTILIYFLMLITLRVMGKREIGELSIFDFAVILLIADVAAVTIDEEYSVFYSIIPMAILLIIQKLLAFLSLKFNFIRNIVDGKRSIIIYENKLNIKEMKKQNYNMEDLLMQARQKDIFSLTNIEFMFLETDGQVSIIKKDKDKNSKPFSEQYLYNFGKSSKLFSKTIVFISILGRFFNSKIFSKLFVTVSKRPILLRLLSWVWP